jgi:hypothetical protein
MPLNALSWDATGMGWDVMDFQAMSRGKGDVTKLQK